MSTESQDPNAPRPARRPDALIISAPISLRSPLYPELTLRTATPADVPSIRDVFVSLANSKLDPGVQDASAFTHEKVTKMVEGWVRAQAEEKPPRVSLVVAVNDVVEGVGGMGHIATDAETGVRTGDAGVVLNETVRRRGYGVEAVRLTTEFAFEVLKLDKVTVTTKVENLPMVALMEKMGWEKKLVSEAESDGGEYIYSMLPEQWAAQNKRT